METHYELISKIIINLDQNLSSTLECQRIAIVILCLCVCIIIIVYNYLKFILFIYKYLYSVLKP